MRDFKKNIKKAGRCALFFLILISLFLGMQGYMISASKRDETLVHARNKNLVGTKKERAESIDVIVLGDSLSYTSVSPMQLWKDYHVTSYICGQAGQKIQETYYILKTALEKQSPKVVFLETNVMFRGQSGINGLKNTIAEKGNYYFPIFRIHDIWKPLLTGIQYKDEMYKGFILRDIVKPYCGGAYMKPTKKKAKIPDAVYDYMDDIISMCREHGIKLVLYSSPSPDNYNYERHNVLEEYARDYSLDYIDMNLKLKDIGIDWKTDSFDGGDHLNLCGAEKVTDYIAKYIKSTCNISDIKSDIVYKEWENELVKYNETVKKKLEIMRMQ